MTIFYSLRLVTSPNLEGHVLVFICPRNKVAQLNPQALGSLFVAYYLQVEVLEPTSILGCEHKESRF
jgi:hypothetical protein